MKFWIRTSFWDKVIKTLALFGAPTVGGLGYFRADDCWIITSGIFALAAAGLAIWMVDKDKNGVVDIFE